LFADNTLSAEKVATALDKIRRYAVAVNHPSRLVV